MTGTKMCRMPLSRFRAGFRLALLCGAASARADDAAGILRVGPEDDLALRTLSVILV